MGHYSKSEALQNSREGVGGFLTSKKIACWLDLSGLINNASGKSWGTIVKCLLANFGIEKLSGTVIMSLIRIIAWFYNN